MKISPSYRQSALTLNEVILVLGSVLILAALLLPALARSKPNRSVNCVSNLKQVGLGWLQWVHDNDSGELPFRTPVAKGGTLGSSNPLRNTASWQFSIISNELNSPKILVCPVDKNVGPPRRVADNWSAADPKGGFLTQGFSDQATSYTIGLDAVSQRPDSILGSDRNILFDGVSGTCSSGLSGQSVRVSVTTGQNSLAGTGWTNAIHGLRGNVACVDGSVQQVTTKELRALCELSDDNGNTHFLVPQ